MLAAELRQRNTKAVQAWRIEQDGDLKKWLPIFANEKAESMISGVEAL